MIKLQLDGTALKHLIDSSGPEFAVELRKGTVANMAQSYRTLLADEVKTAVKESVDNEFLASQDNVAYTITNSRDTYGRVVKKAALRDEFKKAIAEEAKTAVTNTSRDMINQYVTDSKADIEKSATAMQTHLEGEIDKIIRLRMSSTINQYITDEVERRLADALSNTKGE